MLCSSSLSTALYTARTGPAPKPIRCSRSNPMLLPVPKTFMQSLRPCLLFQLTCAGAFRVLLILLPHRLSAKEIQLSKSAQQSLICEILPFDAVDGGIQRPRFAGALLSTCVLNVYPRNLKNVIYYPVARRPWFRLSSHSSRVRRIRLNYYRYCLLSK